MTRPRVSVIVVTFLPLMAIVARRAGAQESSAAKLSFTLQTDIDAFRQDSTNRVQVGRVPTVGEVRQARTALAGSLTKPFEWTYIIAIDGTGLYRTSSPALSINQLAVTLSLSHVGRLTVGKQREGVGREMIESRVASPLVERSPSTTAFLPTRNDGIRLSNTIFNERATWSAGVFNSFLTNHLSFVENGSQVSGRVSALPWLSCDSLDFVHLGASARWSDDQEDSLRFSSHPQANAAPNFLDTKSIPTDGSAMLAGEFAFVRGPVSILSEGSVVRLSAPSTTFSSTDSTSTATTTSPSGPAHFHGYYLELSWFPRGEHRKYDRTTGTFGDVDMRGHLNTFELAAEYNATNLRSGSVDGGVLDRGTIAASWYRTRNLRLALNAGYARLALDNELGWTRLLIARVQWILD